MEIQTWNSFEGQHSCRVHNDWQPIAERKQRLLDKTMRITSKAADRVENQIDGANITHATVAFGLHADEFKQ
jgi:hypothetical protein